MNIDQFIKKHYVELNNEELAEKCGVSEASVRRHLKKLGLKRSEKLITDEIADDILHNKSRKEKRGVEQKYKALQEKIAIVEAERDAVIQINKGIQTYAIKPNDGKSSSEATYVMVASDWHIEEEVKPENVNGLNKYNLELSKERADMFFRNGHKLLKMFQKDVNVNTVVLALLGDFISNSIHEELMEANLLSPIDAIIRCQNYIASGIEFLLRDSSIEELIIVCHTGNHGRTTKERRHATESGNSLEYFMYNQLANHFQGNKRVKFMIPMAYHSYLDIYGYTLRFHHGHNMSYGGGVGGITISVNKAIAQWDKIRKADLDVFGHFHQFLDGGKFIANGSMIGFNAYALSIKANFETPKQASFLIDKKRFKTLVAPIMFI